jgi:hypothetical protein
MLRYLSPFLLAALLLASMTAAYGHGLGADQTLPVTLGNKQVAMQASMTPNTLAAVATSKPLFSVRAFDPGSNSTIADLDYRVVVEHGGETFLDQQFHSSDGFVVANLIPDAKATAAQVNGQTGAGRVEVSRENHAQIRSRILSDGGLYHVAATIEKTSNSLQLQDDRTFDLYVSVAKKQDFKVDTPEGPQTMSTTTYYADAGNFAYNNGMITFSMPFDWRPEYVQQVPLVHMEVQFPKGIKELQANSYRGTINNVELPADALYIDDYSFPGTRIVHFVLNNDRLTSLAGKAKGDTMAFALSTATKPKFPLDLMSATERYMWEISWGPEVIATGTPTTFVMNMQDGKVGGLLPNSSFDFVLSKDGKEVYRQHLTSGQGTFSLAYTFGEAGTYRLAAEKINGSSENAQLDIVVIKGSGTSAPGPQKQQPSGCLIATAAFGSELTPQVQFLRGFRDNYIVKSESGAAFMNAFNAVYYSFSPQVADYEREQPWLQTTVKTAIYPLFGILLVSERAFSVAGGDGGAVLAGASASTLIGAVYVAPALAAATVIRKRRIGNRLVLASLAAATVSLAAIAVALQAGSGIALLVSTSAFVISAAATAALAVAKAASRLR